MHTKTRASRSHTSVVEPATPATTKFHYREVMVCQVNGTKCSTPFGDVGVPIARDWNTFNLTVAAFKNVGEKSRVDVHAQEVGQVTWPGLHVSNCVATDHLLRIERRSVVQK
jgi:hypothetical protein